MTSWRIAGAELDKLLPGTPSRARNHLVTSVVRQWITSAGHAGVFTADTTFWLHLQPPGRPGGRQRPRDALGRVLPDAARPRGTRRAPPGDPASNLSLRPSAVFATDGGDVLRVSPHLRRFEIKAPDE
ncbi:hypothetical protein [Frigoriglobus tundricola]|uniref:Uncharacterized protein n=1 Tax=Frigoriglobus tundricola TaxID=2774151 RepID=A0A6M5YM01_9BACT|nr:hypothetical protein [Frigoriglobus tundricola]QJW94356.1 hypothetical protein FTUN_1876 [Frigoriglobus tundricola]